MRFIFAELDLAITFCEGGLSTHDANRAERDAENARKALQTVSRLKDRISTTEEERKIIFAKLDKLTTVVEQLEREIAARAGRRRKNDLS